MVELDDNEILKKFLDTCATVYAHHYSLWQSIYLHIIVILKQLSIMNYCKTVSTRHTNSIQDTHQ